MELTERETKLILELRSQEEIKKFQGEIPYFILGLASQYALYLKETRMNSSYSVFSEFIQGIGSQFFENLLSQITEGKLKEWLKIQNAITYDLIKIVLDVSILAAEKLPVEI